MTSGSPVLQQLYAVAAAVNFGPRPRMTSWPPFLQFGALPFNPSLLNRPRFDAITKNIIENVGKNAGSPSENSNDFDKRGERFYF
jgi:hypothetical protein